MIDFFLRRPIFAAVCALVILLAGLVAIPNLPIAQFPQVAPPVVTVSTTYIGANAQDVESSVTTPLEEAINGIQGLRYISSVSGNDGSSTITCTFSIDRDIDLAATDVQSAVNNTMGQLPEQVIQTGVTVTKNSGSFLMGIGLYSDNPRYNSIYLSNYVDLYIKDTLKRIQGVNDVRVFGERLYAMRLWVDPRRLAQNGLGAQDVVSALLEQNVVVAAGSLGQPPDISTQPYQIAIRTQGQLKTPEDFDNLILKTTPDGGVVRFGDVGHVDLGAQDYSSSFRFDGKPAIGFGILTLPSANGLQVAKDVYATLDQLAKSFPAGIHYQVGFDSTTFVGESIREVLKTLLLSIVLVVIVIYLFLQNWRTTLIPAVTIPVSLIGTFALMSVLGFSINTLTLFGLTLATGLVVDDAIVVIENIARFIQEKHMSPLEGASLAMKEIMGAIVASSIVLLAVFVPVAFFPGTTGQLYKQFAMTIACAIVISLFNALTLTPALSAMLLGSREEHSRWLRPVNWAIEWTRHSYHWLLSRIFRWRILVLGVFALALVGTVFAYQTIPTGFLPDEDLGYFFITAQLPEGSTLAQTMAVTHRVEQILDTYPEVKAVFEPNGFSFAGSGPNLALMFVRLSDWSQRARADQSVNAIMASLRAKVAKIPQAQILVFNPPAIRGIGNFAGFQFELEDKGNLGLQKLLDTGRALIRAANAGAVIRSASTTFRNDAPLLVVSVDRIKAKSLGVSLTQVFSTLQIFLGSDYVNNFTYLNRSWRVYVQADDRFRSTPQEFQQLYVPGLDGAEIPLSTFVSFQQIRSAPRIVHYNLFRSLEINGIPAPGYGSGQTVVAMSDLAAKLLPPGMSYEWSGISLEQLTFNQQAIIIFGLGLIFVFLTLAAKYESWTDPMIILVSVPLAILGAVMALDIRGYVSDLYAQVGYLMLIALASKNAILIVEFANQLREQGVGTVDAVRRAAETRLRPILMTSLAFILAVVPLVLASGAGSASRHSLGTAVFGGMIVSSFLNLVVVPVLYVMVVNLRERIRPVPHASTHGSEWDQSGTVRRTPDGTIEVVFQDGERPLVYRLPVEGDHRNGEPTARKHPDALL